MSCFKHICLSCPSEKGGWSHSVLSESWLSANPTHEDPRGEGLHLPCVLLVFPCCILCSTLQFCNVCYRLMLTSRVCPEHLLYSVSLLLLFIEYESTPLNFGSCDFLTLECQSTNIIHPQPPLSFPIHVGLCVYRLYQLLLFIVWPEESNAFVFIHCYVNSRTLLPKSKLSFIYVLLFLQLIYILWFIQWVHAEHEVYLSFLFFPKEM